MCSPTLELGEEARAKRKSLLCDVNVNIIKDKLCQYHMKMIRSLQVAVLSFLNFEITKNFRAFDTKHIAYDENRNPKSDF